MRSQGSMWPLAFALAVLLLAIAATAAGTRSRQIYDLTWAGRAGAAANPMDR